MKKRNLVMLVGCISICSAVFGATAQKISAELKQQKIVCNGSAQTKEVISYNGTTYVPLRQFGEMTGTSINYDSGVIYVGENNTVTEPVKADKKEFTFTINGVTTGINYEDKKVAIVNMSMLNNSGETQSPGGSLYSFRAYQNGVELESSFDSDLVAHDEYTNVLNGSTIDFQSLFILKDDSPITLEVTEFLGDDKVSKTFNIK